MRCFMAANTNNQQKTQPQARPIALKPISNWLLSVGRFILGKMKEMLHSFWQKIIQHPVAAIFVFIGSALAITLIVVLVLGYLLNWHWTGLVPEASEPNNIGKRYGTGCNC